MKFTILITGLAAFATAMPALSQSGKLGGKLNAQEAQALETLAKQYNDVQTAMHNKYNVHWCPAEDFYSCEKKCAYFYDMSPNDGLESDGCMTVEDKKTYDALGDSIDDMKAMLTKKYGVEVPSGAGP